MTICNKCGYKWQNKVLNPKGCPRCKVRLDAPKPQNSIINEELIA